MKKYIVLLLLVAGIGSLKAQSFLERLPTVKTGLKGCIKDGAPLRVLGHNDENHKVGSSTVFELLNISTIKDKNKVATIKVKIISDYDNASNVGLVGYVTVSSTSLAKFYTEGSTKLNVDFKNLIPTQTTGWKGVVTFDGLPFWVNGFTDTVPLLPTGTKVELLSSKLVRTNDCLELCYGKFKVLDGPYVGKVGYAYAALTDFDNTMDYPGLVITGPPSATTTPTTNPTTTTGSWDIPDYATERTGVTGTVTVSTGAYAYEDGSDWLDEVSLPENSTFVLLNRKVFQDAMTSDYYIKTKVTYDPTGTYTGKILYITILDTDLSGRFNSSDDPIMVN